jgi:hypothetical protein
VLLLWKKDPAAHRIAACGLFALLGLVHYTPSLLDLSDPGHVVVYRDRGWVTLRASVVGERDVQDIYTNPCLPVDRLQIERGEHSVMKPRAD